MKNTKPSSVFYYNEYPTTSISFHLRTLFEERLAWSQYTLNTKEND